MTQKAISHLCFIIFIAGLNYLWHDYSINIPFPHQISANFKGIDSSLLAFLFTQIVKNKLKIFTRRSKHNLVFPAVKLIVKDLHQVIVDKDVAVDDIEHTSYFHILVLRVEQSNWIKMIYTAVFLYDEAALDKFAGVFV